MRHLKIFIFGFCLLLGLSACTSHTVDTSTPEDSTEAFQHVDSDSDTGSDSEGSSDVDTAVILDTQTETETDTETETETDTETETGTELNTDSTDVCGSNAYVWSKEDAADTDRCFDISVRSGASMIDGELSKNVVRQILHCGMVDAIKECYWNVLQADSALEGRVSVNFHIDASGSVSSVEVASTTLQNEIFLDCVMNRLSELIFPAPEDGEIVAVTYPFQVLLNTEGDTDTNSCEID